MGRYVYFDIGVIDIITIKKGFIMTDRISTSKLQIIKEYLEIIRLLIYIPLGVVIFGLLVAKWDEIQVLLS